MKPEFTRPPRPVPHEIGTLKHSDFVGERGQLESLRDQILNFKTPSKAKLALTKEAVDKCQTRVRGDYLLNVPGMQPLRRELLQMPVHLYL